jgi:hypothetical protein
MAQQLDALLVRWHAAGREDNPAMYRVLQRLEAPLPPQRGILPKWWPAALLESDLHASWPRFAPLADLAILGFAVGLSDIGTTLNMKSASAVIGSAASSDSDLSLMIFEPDPRATMRPR